MAKAKWLLVFICAASFIGGFATSLKILGGADPENAISATKPDSGTESDLGIERYRLRH